MGLHGRESNLDMTGSQLQGRPTNLTLMTEDAAIRRYDVALL